MYKIVKKQELTTNIYLMEVEANRVAKTCETRSVCYRKNGQ